MKNMPHEADVARMEQKLKKPSRKRRKKRICVMNRKMKMTQSTSVNVKNLLRRTIKKQKTLPNGTIMIDESIESIGKTQKQEILLCKSINCLKSTAIERLKLKLLCPKSTIHKLRCKKYLDKHLPSDMKACFTDDTPLRCLLDSNGKAHKLTQEFVMKKLENQYKEWLPFYHYENVAATYASVTSRSSNIVIKTTSAGKNIGKAVIIEAVDNNNVESQIILSEATLNSSEFIRDMRKHNPGDLKMMFAEKRNKNYCNFEKRLAKIGLVRAELLRRNFNVYKRYLKCRQLDASHDEINEVRESLDKEIKETILLTKLIFSSVSPDMSFLENCPVMEKEQIEKWSYVKKNVQDFLMLENFNLNNAKQIQCVPVTIGDMRSHVNIPIFILPEDKKFADVYRTFLQKEIMNHSLWNELSLSSITRWMRDDAPPRFILQSGIMGLINEECFLDVFSKHDLMNGKSMKNEICDNETTARNFFKKLIV
jgi:hypothetical protein